MHYDSIRFIQLSVRLQGEGDGGDIVTVGIVAFSSAAVVEWYYANDHDALVMSCMVHTRVRNCVRDWRCSRVSFFMVGEEELCPTTMQLDKHEELKAMGTTLGIVFRACETRTCTFLVWSSTTGSLPKLNYSISMLKHSFYNFFVAYSSVICFTMDCSSRSLDTLVDTN